MNKRIFKQQNAITLVALIITIVILLILAMVSISLVMNTGIIEKSEYSKDKYKEEEIAEQLKLVYSEWQMSQFIDPMSIQDIEDKLEEIFGQGNVSDVSLANGKLTATIYGKNYEYNVTTGVAGEKKPQALSTITKDNYGDYIDLGQSVVGTSATTDDWRILYNDKNGHVYAILADYLPNSNAAVTASGLNTSGTYIVNSSTSRDDLLSKLNNTTAWQSLIPEGLRSTCQVKGATTAEIIMASYNEKYGTSLVYTSYPYLYIDADSSKGVDTLYMPHPGSSDYNGCYGYWLASPNADDAGRVWSVYSRGHMNDINYSSSYYGVCPVVSLPSNIQVIKNGTVWTVVQ